MKITETGRYLTFCKYVAEVTAVHSLEDQLFCVSGHVIMPDGQRVNQTWKMDGMNSHNPHNPFNLVEEIRTSNATKEQLEEALKNLLNAINCDKDGDFFICQEDTYVITDAEMLLDPPIKAPR